MLFTLICLVLCMVVQSAYWLILFQKLVNYIRKAQPAAVATPTSAVSIIICARNEADNLRNNLPLVLTQDYPYMEVIVVDDGSEDDTALVLAQLKQAYPVLKIISVPKARKKGPGKRYALKTGIEAAGNELILVTDADCRPSTQSWVKTMAGSLAEKELVLGFAPFHKSIGILNGFVRFEGLMTALQFMSYALTGMPYMGVGRNMGYKKQLFNEINGFEKHYNLASGDDDLLVRNLKKINKVGLQTGIDSFVYSAAPSTLKAYFRQKKRHVGTAIHYKFIHQLLLAIYAFTHILFYLSALFLLGTSCVWIALFALAFRFFMLRITLKPVAGRFLEQDLIPRVMVFDFLFVFYYLSLLPFTLFNKRSEWT